MHLPKLLRKHVGVHLKHSLRRPEAMACQHPSLPRRKTQQVTTKLTMTCRNRDGYSYGVCRCRPDRRHKIQREGLRYSAFFKLSNLLRKLGLFSLLWPTYSMSDWTLCMKRGCLLHSEPVRFGIRIVNGLKIMTLNYFPQ